MTNERADRWVARVGWKKLTSVGAAVVLVAGATYLGFVLRQKIDEAVVALTPQELPEMPTIEHREFMAQGWTSDQSSWFHHASQGTMTLPIPYRWFVALEQPKSSPWFLGFGSEDELACPDYLARLGFIRGRGDGGCGPHMTPSDLPIGFAATPSQPFEPIGETATAIGLTCAACHTGHFVVGTTEYIVDGGPAVTDLGTLTQVLGAALGQTALSAKVPLLGSRFERFAERVLGKEPATNNAITRQQLRSQLDATLTELTKRQDSIHVTEGYARLDALNRIGNQIFAEDFGRPVNRVAIDAPVNYPFLWTTSWFDWVQYDGSIMQPLARNTGEALGVSAHVNLDAPLRRKDARWTATLGGTSPDQDLVGKAAWMISAVGYREDGGASPGETSAPVVAAPGGTSTAAASAGVTLTRATQPESYGQRFASSVPVDNLHAIEAQIAGPDPVDHKGFGGLQAPSWPEAFGAIDTAKVSAGKELYEERCAGCHLPDLKSERIWSHMSKISYEQDGEQRNTPEQYLRLKIIPLREIGTDPRQASVLAERTVNVTGLGLDTSLCAAKPSKPGTTASSAWDRPTSPLTFVPVTDSPVLSFPLALAAVIEQTNEQWFDQRYIPEGWRSTYEGQRPNCVQAGAGYRARPLNGVWATAPFLHNGSVPTLDDLLSPAEERPTFVQLGSPKYDIERVGLLQEGPVARLKPDAGEAVPEYIDGYFILDTRLEGNWNTGHEFSDEPGPGVIGKALDATQRAALIEYLKTL